MVSNHPSLRISQKIQEKLTQLLPFWSEVYCLHCALGSWDAQWKETTADVKQQTNP